MIENFDRLTVLKEVARDKWDTYYLCECSCGSIKVRTRKYLKSKKMVERSCGCSNSEWRIQRNISDASRGGISHTDEYKIMNSIMQRCYNKNHTHYASYGGRGITVCDRWSGAKGIENFINDMGKRPSKGHSVDRINVNEGYSPDNCRWATHKEQSLNRRNTKKYDVFGTPLTITEIADKYRINRNTLYSFTKRRGIEETIKHYNLRHL